MLQGMLSPRRESQRCSAAPAGLRRGPVAWSSSGRWWAEISWDHPSQWISELQPQVRFGRWMWDAAACSHTPETGCYSVAGLCLHLNQCTKQGQTSPQLSGTPELLGCLHATKLFTPGVLRTSCDPPQAHKVGCQSSKRLVPASGTRCKPSVGWRMVPGVAPSIQGAVPGANPPQEHAQASLEKSKLGRCSRRGEMWPHTLP